MPHHFPIQGLSFLDKKSLATAFARFLGPVACAGSPHDLGMQITGRFLDNLGGGRSLTATLENARGTFQQRPLPLMDHRWMDLASGRKFRYRAIAF
jgi:hypothetical protein